MARPGLGLRRALTPDRFQIDQLTRRALGIDDRRVNSCAWGSGEEKAASGLGPLSVRFDLCLEARFHGRVGGEEFPRLAATGAKPSSNYDAFAFGIWITNVR